MRAASAGARPRRRESRRSRHPRPRRIGTAIWAGTRARLAPRPGSEPTRERASSQARERSFAHPVSTDLPPPRSPPPQALPTHIVARRSEGGKAAALALPARVGDTDVPMPGPSGVDHVESHGLRKTYGLLPVLRGIELNVPAGQTLALLGANGAGKSTLLRCLAGVCRPTAGRLAIFGTECHPQRPPRDVLGQIGLVAHDPLVYLDLTPRQNLAFFARLHRVPSARVDPQLERLGLVRVADRRTRTLSRGTSQRLALARALLPEPRLLLLDEPFTGLDDAGQEVLCEILAESARAGTSAVLVSHDLGRVAAIADRVVILAGGRVAADRTPVPLAADLAALYRGTTSASPRGRAGRRDLETEDETEDVRVDDRP